MQDTTQQVQATKSASTPELQRKRLLSLAYGLLGSLTEAEDAVQETLLRFQQVDQASIHNVDAWTTTVLTRIAIDKLRSAQRQREVYPGEWLPEPIFHAPDAEQHAITRSRLSIALLYLLEKLEPEQRIVFVFREVFEYSYRSIAGILGKSEDACRQLMLRARTAVERARQTPPVSRALAESLLSRFSKALADGDEKEMLDIIAPDAVLVGDGGGKVRSVINPVFGADRIVRFFLGILHKGEPLQLEQALVNSEPGILVFRAGELNSVVGVSIYQSRISGIYSISNPDKIQARS